jgi:hypothetical protein
VTFRERSVAVSRTFLQSVVVFDDLAQIPLPSGAPMSQVDESPPAEGEQDAFGHSPGVLTPPSDPAGPTPDEAGVDIKRLSDAFAEKGLICGFLRPGPQESDSEAYLLVESARRADIVVLDWVINRDEGETARRIVGNLLKGDREVEEERLRLIAIYTSQRDLDQIVDGLAESLEKERGSVAERRDYTLTVGALRIVVFAKEFSAVTGSAVGQRVSEEDLPQRLIEEFADFTMGLVPNVVLAGLAAVRTDTHRVLQRLDRQLDSAYLGQRLLLGDPAEAEDQLVGLLTSELGSVMEDRGIGSQAGAAAIGEWVQWQLQDGPFPYWEGASAQQVEEEVKALLEHGLRSDEPVVEHFRGRKPPSGKSKAHIHAGRIFARTDEIGDEANNELAIRFTLRTHYSNPARVLQLGTLVESEEGFLLCVQPVCDSVRLDEERDFPFLPLVVADAKFDIVLRGVEGQIVKLSLERKPHALRQHRFRPDADTRCVIATNAIDRWIFTDTADRRYQWIARLQVAHGQRVAHGLGSDFGRVGLSESEWLRMVSGQRED